MIIKLIAAALVIYEVYFYAPTTAEPGVPPTTDVDLEEATAPPTTDVDLEESKADATVVDGPVEGAPAKA